MTPLIIRYTGDPSVLRRAFLTRSSEFGDEGGGETRGETRSLAPIARFSPYVITRLRTARRYNAAGAVPRVGVIRG